MSGCNNCHSTENDTLPKGCKSNGTCSTIGCDKLSVFDWLANIQLPKGVAEFPVVEVRFKNDRKGYYTTNNNISLSLGDVVTVESTSGHDVGVVSLMGELVKTQLKLKKIRDENILKLFRKSSQKDIDTWQVAREKETNMKIEARKIARRLNLTMKICDVEFQGDGTKATFYYTAEGRVDFRDLIKEYATQFKTKIDMRQIGYRQESAKVGGIGSCGRELCCATWLSDFRSVNTAAARYQQLSINPQKLAGQCGKLKCCLNYELDSYLDALHNFPSSSTVLITEKGNANCIKIDVFRKKMWFTYENSYMTWFDFSINEVIHFIEKNKKGEKIADLADLVKEKKDNKPDFTVFEENNLNRFDEKRNPRRNNKPKTDYRKPQENSTSKKNTDSKSKNPINNNSQNQNSNPTQNKKKKNFRYKNKPNQSKD